MLAKHGTARESRQRRVTLVGMGGSGMVQQDYAKAGWIFEHEFAPKLHDLGAELTDINFSEATLVLSATVVLPNFDQELRQAVGETLVDFEAEWDFAVSVLPSFQLAGTD
jgi:hypothetical protein